MSDSRVEQIFPYMFEFGRNTKTGLVDVATPIEDTYISCSKEHAEKLISDNFMLVKTLEEMVAIAEKHAPLEVDCILSRKELVNKVLGI